MELFVWPVVSVKWAVELSSVTEGSGAVCATTALETPRPKLCVNSWVSANVREIVVDREAFYMGGMFTVAWVVVQTPLFGSGMGPIHLDDVHCQGNETSLLDCSHREMRRHNCYRSNEVAVVCRAGEILTIKSCHNR